MDETANQEEVLERLRVAVKNLNDILKEAEAASLPIGVTFPLRADTSEISIWQFGEMPRNV